MEKSPKYDISKLKNLESIKEFCNSHLFEIATEAIDTENFLLKIRFIDSNSKFGYTSLGRFFFVDDCMYIMSRDKKYESEHNPDILDYDEDLVTLKFTGFNIVRVIFAGVFTGFYDDKGERIFTGDVVIAKILLNPTIPSIGGDKRAKNINKEDDFAFCEAGVNDFNETYCFILDNQSIPLSWATELKVVGSLFYDLNNYCTELVIRDLCNSFAQSRISKNELKKLLKKSPYYTPVTWQEKAIELLCGENNEDNS